MPVLSFEGDAPKIGADLFLAPDAWVIGKTEIADKVSIFFGAVLRGDINKIIIGEGSNIQEHCVLHTSKGLGDTVVGSDVTVGHKAVLHGCKVGDRCIIGMNSVILDNSQIGEDSIVGAHSLVSMGKVFPARSLILGSPAKVVRELTPAELDQIKDSARRYREKGLQYRKIL
jgi:carbonic anhydrase/acetyltransferase-like protein (isoleucine patch superfamily)